jgi:hypothetical protein
VTRVRTSLFTVFKLIRTSHDSSQSPKFRQMTRQNPESDLCYFVLKSYFEGTNYKNHTDDYKK